MTKKLLPLLLTAAFAISAAEPPRVTRAMLDPIEKNFDTRFQNIGALNESAVQVFGRTRGVYLPGIGIVFSAEVGLVTPNLSLMSPSISDKEKAQLRQQKSDRIKKLKAMLKDAMISLAATLDPVPSDEQIAVAIILPRYPGEEGVPVQLTMQAQKAKLLELQRVGGAGADLVIKTTEQ